MLRACRRLIAPGGAVAFFTIHPAPRLSDVAYRRACRLGPRSVATRRREHGEILRRAGFVAVEVVDLTSELLATARALRAADLERETELRPRVGETAWRDRLRKLEQLLTALDESLLRRSLFVAR